MPEPLVELVLKRISQASGLYNRLVLIVAPAGLGKTTTLQYINERMSIPLINLNLELSKYLLELTVRQRALKLPRLVADILEAYAEEVILLDNIELLFDVSLKLDPLQLLKKLSRNKTVVAAWNGNTNGEHIFYAAHGHPEYRKYTLGDFLLVSPETIA